jgi:hypothetical protein
MARETWAAAGLVFRGDLNADGNVHYAHVEGDSKNSKKGWYVLHADYPPNGVAGSCKTGQREPWRPEGAPLPSPEKRIEIEAKINANRAIREAELKAKREAAVNLAQAILNGAVPAPANDSHDYLQRKRIKAHGPVKIGTWIKELTDQYASEVKPPLEIENTLVIPLYAFDNAEAPGERPTRQLVSAQGIFPSEGNALKRGKDFVTGGQKQAAWFSMGKPIGVNGDGIETVAICEGYPW